MRNSKLVSKEKGTKRAELEGERRVRPAHALTRRRGSFRTRFQWFCTLLLFFFDKWRARCGDWRRLRLKSAVLPPAPPPVTTSISRSCERRRLVIMVRSDAVSLAFQSSSVQFVSPSVFRLVCVFRCDGAVKVVWSDVVNSFSDFAYK